MNVMKRASLYLKRKKGRMLSMLFLLFLMSSFILLGISLKRSAEKESDSLRQSLATGFVLEVDTTNEVYHENWNESGADSYAYTGPKITEEMLEKINSIDGVKDYIVDLSEIVWADLELKPGMWAAAEPDDEPVPGSWTVSEEDLMVWRKKALVWPCRNGEMHKNFRTGALTISAGRNIEEGDHFKAVISEWLAEKNHLSVGDFMTIETKEGLFRTGEKPMNTWGEPVELEVVGLFHTNFSQQASENTAEEGLIENVIYADMDTYRKLEENFDAVGFAVGYRDGYTRAEFLVEDPGKLDAIMQQVEQSEEIDLENITLTVDSTAYQATVKPYRQIRIFAMILLVVGIAGMGIILYLVLKLWVQGRKHEVGILFSVGIRKGEILGQMLLENLFVSVTALILAFMISGPLIGKSSDAVEYMAKPKANTESYEVTLSDLYEPVITKVASGEVVLDHKVSGNTMFFTIFLVCGVSSIGVILSFSRISSLELRKLM